MKILQWIYILVVCLLSQKPESKEEELELDMSEIESKELQTKPDCRDVAVQTTPDYKDIDVQIKPDCQEVAVQKSPDFWKMAVRMHAETTNAVETTGRPSLFLLAEVNFVIMHQQCNI